MPDTSAGISPLVTRARPPRAVGDVVLAAEPLRHGLANAATAGIWRVRGPAGSAILKAARRPAGHEPARAFPSSDEPGHWNYWRREALAYQTGLAATAYADAGIAAPELLEAAARADGGFDPRHPGHRCRLGSPGPGRRLARGLRHRLRRLHADHDRLLAHAAGAERTLCRDVSNLIIDSCADGLMDIALLPEIAASATDGYLRGLRDGGWTGSADAVLATVAACGAAKYSWLAPMVAGRAARDHLGPSSYGQDNSAAAAALRLTHNGTQLGHFGHTEHDKPVVPGSSTTDADLCPFPAIGMSYYE